MGARQQVASLKQEIEAKLAGRIPAALSPLAQQLPRLHPVGNARVDELLGGGLPVGSVCELTGPEGSGRSSVALSLLAVATAEGACAYVDASDAFSPESAAAAGVVMPNLLWVRFVAETQTTAGAVGRVRRAVQGEQERSHRPLSGGCGRPHPRGETRDLAPALKQMLFCKEERRQKKMEGTPGHPNQPIGLHTASRDQVEWERFNLRRVDETDPLRQADRAAAETARRQAALNRTQAARMTRERKPWERLDRALRATDQILQSGGFRAVVLDLASVAPEQVLRVQTATWWRFQKAAQQSDAILLLLTREPCAKSCAACVLECSAEGMPRVKGVLAATMCGAQVMRQRSGLATGRKAPGRVTGWEAMLPSMRAVGR